MGWKIFIKKMPQALKISWNREVSPFHKATPSKRGNTQKKAKQLSRFVGLKFQSNKPKKDLQG